MRPERISLVWCWPLGAALLLGCFSTKIDDGEAEGDDEAEAETGDPEWGEDWMESGESSESAESSSDTDDPPPDVDAVSVLLVVDNSGSMGEEQAALAAAAEQLTAALDAAQLDWRIGVTTTDNGNPWCPSGTTTPEGGKLVFSSCRARLGDFLFGDSVDVQDLACNDLCPHQSVDVSATTTTYDPTPAPRPWIERSGGQLNVEVPLGEALACVVPQGVNGCGFESQLESAYLAVQRSANNGEASYGFFDEQRLPVIVFISDEADCSYNKEWATIFEQDGNKVFWSDPAASFPTSAVCWNAGTSCTGPSNDLACVAADYDIEGVPTDDPNAAVLQPLQRYVQGLRAGGINPLVFGVLGVDSQGEVHYAEGDDPLFVDSFGIGPGCTAPGGVTAVPPVRMLALAEEHAPPAGRKLYSVCANNFGPAMTDIGATIVDALE